MFRSFIALCPLTLDVFLVLKLNSVYHREVTNSLMLTFFSEIILIQLNQCSTVLNLLKCCHCTENEALH